MDTLDRLLQHDAWTTAQLLRLATPLSDEQLDRGFDIGLRTCRATFEHMIRNTEVWTDLMNGGPVRDAGDATIAALTGRHHQASADLAALAHRVREQGAMNERWTDTLDDPPTTRTFGGAITHVITHGMHHRAQLLFMLRRLGVGGVPEGDVLSWERQVIEGSEQGSSSPGESQA